MGNTDAKKRGGVIYYKTGLAQWILEKLNYYKRRDIQMQVGEDLFLCSWRPTKNPKAIIPEEKSPYFTVWHEIELKPGEQYTIVPNILHWFQAGDEGAIVSEFSTTSRDEFDIFTDPDIKKYPVIEDEFN